jgi:hypothetical protein
MDKQAQWDIETLQKTIGVISYEETAKFEIKSADEQVRKIKQYINDCQVRFGKIMGCGTCKALQLCTWTKELCDTIECMKKHIEALQQEMERDAIERAIKALEKQVPQKVKKYKGLNETACPKCGIAFGYYEYDDEKFDYCYNCGQKLDWEGDFRK